jgi:hypothetical protein
MSEKKKKKSINFISIIISVSVLTATWLYYRPKSVEQEETEKIKEKKIIEEIIQINETEPINDKVEIKTPAIKEKIVKRKPEPKNKRNKINIQKTTKNLLDINKFILVKASNFIKNNQEFKITKDYYISKYEVTQLQWKLIMGENHSHFQADNLPVENISWYDAQKFIKKLNQITGKNYRLPTEAEWEYAARGGDKSNNYIYSGSNNIDDVSWYWNNSSLKTHPVGLKNPNELGIYDMSGNVYEWCYDWYGEYPNIKVLIDYRGPDTGVYRVIKGGSWFSDFRYSQSDTRNRILPDHKHFSIGFRLVLSGEGRE